MHAKEIETVFDSSEVVMGYRARRSCIFGYAQGIEDYWVTGRLESGVIKFSWVGYKTRKQAEQALKEKFKKDF